MKKTLTFLLAVIMMMACAISALADSDVLHGYVSTWNNYGLSKDPIVLTIGCGSQDLPASYKDNLQIELIKQATGVQLEFVGYDSEKFAVMSAGGDLPDIFSLENATCINELIDSGAVLDMLPYLDQYGKNIQQVHGDYALIMAKSVYGNDENIYFVPSNVSWLGALKTPVEQVSFNYFVRWDIYQAIGAPAIRDENGFNEDMLLDVFKQMQDYARAKTGTDNVYALSGWVDWGTLWADVLPYGMGVAGKLNMWTKQSTGMVENMDFYGDTKSHYYDALRFYNKAWRMGILDPEMLTLTQSQYDAKVKMGKIVVANNCWFSNDVMDQSVRDLFGEDCNFYLIKGMPYLFGLVNQSNPSGYGIFAANFINSNCQHPERAVAVLDYLRSDEFTRANACGLQGVHWDYDEDGKPVFISEALKARQEGKMDEFWDVANGNYKYFPATKLGMASKACADGYPSDFTNSPEYIMEKSLNNESVQNYLKFYETDARYPGEFYLEWIEEGLSETDAPWNAKLKFKPANTDEYNNLLAKCDAYFVDNHAKVIYADTLEESEAAIVMMAEHEKAMGSQKLLDDEIAKEAESVKKAEAMGF
jgi:putative aldouronate transport system substrate-binding protein